MKKHSLILAALVAATLGLNAGAAEVTSLRGKSTDLAGGDVKSQNFKQELSQGGFERSYAIQPPMIPHKSEKDEITLRRNTCLDCHSEKTYEAKKAPKAGDSHYFDRDGKKTEKISSRRWFCNQCHAPQMEARPLVQNDFEGAN